MRLCKLLALLVLILPAHLFAAGFYVGEIGARGLGRAGADVVNPQDGVAMWRNPAALANQRGASLTLNSTLVWLKLEHERTGPFVFEKRDEDIGGYRISRRKHDDINPLDLGLGADDDWETVFESGTYPSKDKVENKASPFVIACPDFMGDGFDGRGHCPIAQGMLVLGERALQVKGLSIAAGGYGPPTGGYWFWDEKDGVNDQGIDTRFTGPQRYVLIDREVLEAFYQLSAAYRLNRYLAVGVGLQAVESAMRMRVAVSADFYGTEDPTKDAVININAREAYIPSGNIGFWSNPILGLEIGGSLQLPRPVNIKGPVRVDYTAPGLEDFVIDDSKGTAAIRFDMPAIFRIGALYRMQPWFDAELDFVYERWSTWKNNVVKIEDLSFTVRGMDMDPVAFKPVIQPKDFQDTYSVRLGGDVKPLAFVAGFVDGLPSFLSNLLTLRAGYMYETSAIPDYTLDVSIADAPKHCLGAGLGLEYAGARLNVGYQHNFLEDRTVDNTLASVIAPAAEVFGVEGSTAAANGVYRASFDLLAVDLRIDGFDVYDFVFAPADKTLDQPLQQDATSL